MENIKNLVAIILLIFICILPIFAESERGQELCYTTDNEMGACVVLGNCSSAQIRIINFSNNYRDVENIVNNLKKPCDSRNFLNEPVVCCKEAYKGKRKGRGRHQENSDYRRNESNSSPPSTTLIPLLFERIGEEEEPCRTPNFAAGTCRDLVQCYPLMKQLLERQTDPQYAQFLREANRACGVAPPTVCCPTDNERLSPIRKLPSREEGCGILSVSRDKIVGGEEADIGAWPWITLLGYRDEIGDVLFRCGGVLITLGHVLTAAHCVRRDLRFARLGEHDLTTSTETYHIDIEIRKSVPHPEYSRADGHSDIAILYLQENAPLTAFIRPICLPTSRYASYIGSNPYVAGWGRTLEGGQTSNVLLQIQIPVQNNSVCRNSYASLNRWISAKQFDNAVICAGVLEAGKDTCQGDSGGPLMVPEIWNRTQIYTGIGIVSYSIGCARANIPGVYTNIPYFLDWIKQKVEETP